MEDVKKLTQTVLGNIKSSADYHQWWAECRNPECREAFDKSKLLNGLCYNCFAKFSVKDHIPEKYRCNIPTTELNRDAWTAASKFTQSNRSLFIHGGCGSGKTHLAYMSYHKALTMLRKTSFVNMSDVNVFARMKYESKDEYVQRSVASLLKCDLLYLDEFVPENINEDLKTIEYLILDYVCKYGRPRLFITSNLSVEWIGTNMSDRIASRIVGLCDIVQNKDKDYRVEGGKS